MTIVLLVASVVLVVVVVVGECSSLGLLDDQQLRRDHPRRKQLPVQQEGGKVQGTIGEVVYGVDHASAHVSRVGQRQSDVNGLWLGGGGWGEGGWLADWLAG